MKIRAQQQLPQLEKELEGLAIRVMFEKKAKIKADAQNVLEKESSSGSSVVDGSDEKVEDGQEMTENTPEARVEMYKEIAARKQEKQEREGCLSFHSCICVYIDV